MDIEKSPLHYVLMSTNRNVLLGGLGCHTPNILKTARKLAKNQPCCKPVHRICIQRFLECLCNLAMSSKRLV